MSQKIKRSQYDLMHPLFEAIADSDLSAPQAHLLLTLFKFVDGDGVCYPSYNTLQRYTKMSRNTLCKHIQSLSNSHWLSYEPGDKSKSLANTYYLNLERLGFKIEPKVVPIDGFMAPDGTKWSCASEYWSHKNQV